LLELAPNSNLTFPFGFIDEDDMYPTPEFKAHSRHIASFMDLVITTLLDIDRDNEHLIDLGRKHAKIDGVSCSMFIHFGEGVLYALGQMLGDEFDERLQKLWASTMNQAAFNIIQGIHQTKTGKKPRRASM